MNKAIISIFTALSAFIPVSVLAHPGEEHYYEVESTAAAASLGIFLIVLFIVLGLMWLLSFIFWIFMLIHATQNDIPDKTTWIIILVVSFFFGLPLIGAVVYYFSVKKKSDKKVITSKKTRKKTTK